MADREGKEAHVSIFDRLWCWIESCVLSKLMSAWRAINGLPVADHIGKSIHEMIPEIAEIVEPIYRGVIESGKPV